ncbi:Undecaprenyl pyrophosphate synthase [Alkalidesulfovibrio alkalitolerans DSM 16529]|uniref:Isoprenyl transferase n=1 Tax=Alkalidesulfovibrio alkalitolerans DSM 16529 TaxID=1121439 RepID=S7UTY2_9BACT|nr:isoprenyl transferase [Alkalidesulfovibrio alkalitolerans]EPR35778.1 Undecaprenyl pyrophosphate synthase [Alkalidesulfovibrio alkalitolerans DSM 16529]
MRTSSPNHDARNSPAPATVSPDKLPAHVAIIMDGNGRWAKARGLPRSEGHRAGTEAAKAIVTRCRERGVRHLTLYTFSSENWARPKDEIGFLFKLLADFMTRELPSLMEQSIRLVILGEIADLPFATRKVLEHAVKKTARNTAMTLNLALNYGSRAEIVRAVRRIVEDGLPASVVSEEAIAERLYTVGQPDPDLVIRTSGELRLSNYLLFQCAYSEFLFTETLWPDFSPDEFDRALADYASRCRRFGKVGED